MTQAEKWHQTRKERMDSLFVGKQYRIVNEFKKGESKETPLGYKVNSGYVLESLDGVETIFVGKALLNQLADQYNAVSKPEPKKRGRPRKQPLDLAQDWASREVSEDVQQITQPGPVYGNPNANQRLE